VGTKHGLIIVSSGYSSLSLIPVIAGETVKNSKCVKSINTLIIAKGMFTFFFLQTDPIKQIMAPRSTGIKS